MEPIGIFQLASKQAEWLSVRQGVVAGNIANVNTPSYISKDIEPFQSVLDKSATIHMAATSPLHMTEAEATTGSTTSGDIEIKDGEAAPELADELMRSTEIRHQYDLNTGLVKSLNKMMLMVVRK